MDEVKVRHVFRKRIVKSREGGSTQCCDQEQMYVYAYETLQQLLGLTNK